MPPICTSTFEDDLDSGGSTKQSLANHWDVHKTHSKIPANKIMPFKKINWALNAIPHIQIPRYPNNIPINPKIPHLHKFIQ